MSKDVVGLYRTRNGSAQIEGVSFRIEPKGAEANV